MVTSNPATMYNDHAASRTHGAARGPWTAVLTGALVSVAVVFVSIMLIDGAFIPPVAVFGVLFAALAAGVTMSSRRWVTAVAGIAAVGILALNMAFVAEDFAHPETFFSFAPTSLAVIGSLLAATAATASFFRASGRAAFPVAGAAAAVAFAAISMSAVASARVDSDSQAAGDVKVTAKDVEFPETITAKAGEVSFLVANKDRIRHTFVIDGQDVKQELPGSTSRRVTANLAAGSYTFRCDVPGHDTMKGTIEVR